MSARPKLSVVPDSPSAGDGSEMVTLKITRTQLELLLMRQQGVDIEQLGEEPDEYRLVPAAA